MVPDQTSGRIDLIDEWGDLIGPAILIGITEPQHPASPWLTPEGTVAITRDVKVATRRSCDIHRVVGHLGRRKESHFKPLRDRGILEDAGFLFNRQRNGLSWQIT